MTSKFSSNSDAKWLTRWPSETLLSRDNPFVSDAFLTALEDSGVCSTKSGWQPHHLQLSPSICVPVYAKTHSWGEYVFDWSWSQAYDQYGLDYYPKLVIAAPYTPSQGPRLLGVQSLDDANSVIDALQQHCLDDEYSGFHILFSNQQEQQWLDQTSLLRRTDVQFHWRNQGYRDFDDFLDRFASRKRKNVRKERKSIAEQGIEMRVLSGNEIDQTSWNAFYQFYHATYLKRGRHGYLNKAFFDRLLANLRQQLVLVMAKKGDHDVAGALCFRDNNKLYGRYWGCFEEFNNLHFEACYYQGIDYCIAHGLTEFDPGTQGEHKIARGFEPTRTHSYHWLAHPEFMIAAKRFCDDEARMTDRYFEQTQAAVPFKQQAN